MTALQELADEVNGLLTGFNLSQTRSNWLTNSVDADDLTWTVDDTNLSMGEGVVEIDDELVYVRQIDPTSGTLLIAPDGRGYDGTTAASHTAGTRLRVEPTFPKVNIKRAVNVAIGRTYPTIFATETVNLTYTVPTSTYELPAGTEKILSVTYEVHGSSGDWPSTPFWSFDANADTATYPSGKTITLDRGLTPGLQFRVVVGKAPEVLVDADALFSATGLRDTARYAIVLGACAHLMRFIEPVRVIGSSAESDEFDSKKPYLTGTKLANDLEQQFQLELRAEQRRLRQTFPARIHRRS